MSTINLTTSKITTATLDNTKESYEITGSDQIDKIYILPNINISKMNLKAGKDQINFPYDSTQYKISATDSQNITLVSTVDNTTINVGLDKNDTDNLLFTDGVLSLKNSNGTIYLGDNKLLINTTYNLSDKVSNIFSTNFDIYSTASLTKNLIDSTNYTDKIIGTNNADEISIQQNVSVSSMDLLRGSDKINLPYDFSQYTANMSTAGEFTLTDRNGTSIKFLVNLNDNDTILFTDGSIKISRTQKITDNNVSEDNIILGKLKLQSGIPILLDAKKVSIQLNSADISKVTPDIKTDSVSSTVSRETADDYYNQKNYSEAVKYYYILANQGDAESQNKLGLMFLNGLGITKHLGKAFEWLQRSANQKNAEAQNNLAYLYEKGLGTSKDYKKAFDNYTLSANQGNAIAQNNLGLMYLKGLGTSKNESKALDLFKKSSSQTKKSSTELIQPNAQNNLAYMYQNGLGIEKNPTEALKYYQNLADLGNASAENNLGIIYKEGLLGVSKDLVKAFNWFQKSANLGHIDAQNNLGFMYENGFGISENYSEAFRWYELSANQGNANAQNNLGVMYRDAKGVNQDLNYAFGWFSLSAEQGNSNAENNLGYMYENGFGVDSVDISQAVNWYKKSADHQNADALYNLGMIYLNVEKNVVEANKSFQKSADLGNLNAKNALNSTPKSLFSRVDLTLDTQKGDDFNVNGINLRLFNQNLGSNGVNLLNSNQSILSFSDKNILAG